MIAAPSTIPTRETNKRGKTRITDAQIEKWCSGLNLSAAAVAQIKYINASDPVRVGSGSRSMRGWFPSPIMGCMIGFESRTCEGSFVWLRHAVSRCNPDRPLMMLCQPCWLDVGCVTDEGADRSFKYPPDYFELTEKWAGYVECKWLEDLENTQNKEHKDYAPWRYKRIGPDEWSSPPAEAAAAKHGLKHRIWVMSKKKTQLISNLQFLSQYFDSPTVNFDQRVADRIEAIVKGDPGIRLRDILEALKDDVHGSDTLYFCIARQDFYIDIESEPIAPNFAIRVFPNAECADLTLRMEAATSGQEAASDASSEFTVTPGAELTLDGKSYRVLRSLLSTNSVELMEVGADSVIVMSLPELERRVVNGEAHQTGAGHPQGGDFRGAMEEWRRIEPTEWLSMRRNYERVEKYFAAHSRESRRLLGKPTRNDFRLIQKGRAAAEKWGPGFEILGLRPKPRSGNKSCKLDARTVAILAKAITDNFKTAQAPSTELIWGICAEECKEHVPPLKTPCRATVTAHIEREELVKRVASREGSKAAYSIATPFWNESNDELEVDGEFAWAVAHIDHTQLDTETAPTADGLSLGRPWLTIMVAPRQKRVLAYAISYEPPSYRSCMAVVEECVRRHRRLPAVIVTDGGKEFSGGYFSYLMGRFKLVQMFRPAATPRFGSYLERYNGRINSKLIHNLPGNTKITKHVRMLVESHDPKRLATLSLEELDEVVAEFLYNWCENEPDKITGETPKQKYERDLRLGGPRTHKIIVPNESFFILTCPTTKSGVAKVRRDGVKVNHLYYNCAEFRQPGVMNRKVAVRYNPRDLSIIYVRLGNKWITCRCREFRKQFKGLTERELRMATTKLLGACRTLVEKRRQINAGRLARFFKEHGLSPEVQVARRRAMANAAKAARQPPSPQKESGKSQTPREESKPAAPSVVQVAPEDIPTITTNKKRRQ